MKHSVLRMHSRSFLLAGFLITTTRFSVAQGQQIHRYSSSSPRWGQVQGNALNFQRTDYPIGGSVYDVAVGDFNRDGKLDLVVVNDGTNTVGILLGNGDGTFQPHVDYAVGNSPSNVAVGDFNGDGIEDLAVTNSANNSSVSILLGNGDGTFKPHVDYPLEMWAHAVQVGDFNRDGKLDLAIANFASQTVSILLGNGDGTFQPAIDRSTTGTPGDLVVADFNSDGKLDLATAQSDEDTMSVYFGNGDGTFQPGVDYSSGIQPDGIAAGDFNGDGKIDIAVANACGFGDLLCVGQVYPGTVSIFLNNGNGTFKPAAYYPAGFDTLALTVGDFNGDGKLDVAVAAVCGNDPSGNCSRQYVSLLLGNGDGSLQSPLYYPAALQPNAVAVGNFSHTGPGSADMAVANYYYADSVSLLLNDAATRVTLTSSPNPSKHGQPVTFTVTVEAAVKGTGAPTGSVVGFLNGTRHGETPLVNGKATFTTSNLPVGNDRIKVGYSGDNHFNPAISPAIVQQVQP